MDIITLPERERAYRINRGVVQYTALYGHMLGISMVSIKDDDWHDVTDKDAYMLMRPIGAQLEVMDAYDMETTPWTYNDVEDRLYIEGSEHWYAIVERGGRYHILRAGSAYPFLGTSGEVFCYGIPNGYLTLQEAVSTVMGA